MLPLLLGPGTPSRCLTTLWFCLLLVIVLSFHICTVGLWEG